MANITLGMVMVVVMVVMMIMMMRGGGGGKPYLLPTRIWAKYASFQ